MTLYRKSRWKRVLYSKLTIVLMLFLFFFLVRAVIDVYGKYSEAKGNKDEVLARLVELESREEELMKEVQRLQTEKGLEEELRTRFNIAKEGEEVIVIIDESGDEEDAMSGDDNTGFWNWILKFFRRN